ncbi:hypothetical protein LEP1GSC083_1202 [Leptospira interrogans serovar Pyrogenes str. L0374]|uniref:Uncharacterized protein n=1 Tax=Leptospira interrogans serovar Pyrogenes str. L0374 TaxID=1049928 RepID=M6KF15_LEPIR|nr:hypothetical protein LEP1GSC083_1202 [Leptospira interrogans serovar Pyrogenes str. L0374]
MIGIFSKKKSVSIVYFKNFFKLRSLINLDRSSEKVVVPTFLEFICKISICGSSHILL